MSLKLGQVGMGLMQWGSTKIDDKVVNPKGNLSEQEVHELWKTCRAQNIVFFDTAEGKHGSAYMFISYLYVNKIECWVGGWCFFSGKLRREDEIFG
jgi:aryl-alcohol dehydrogenase-like predicted oxidoreductase